MEFNGTYKVIAKMPVLGRQRGEIKFECEGDKLSGTTTFMRNEVPMENLVIDGNSFTATCDAPSPTGPMHMEVSGTIDGDKISGIMKTPLGNMTYSGERAE